MKSSGGYFSCADQPILTPYPLSNSNQASISPTGQPRAPQCYSNEPILTPDQSLKFPHVALGDMARLLLLETKNNKLLSQWH